MNARILMVAAFSVTVFSQAQAAGPDNGYGFSGAGEVWRDGYGSCVQSRYRDAGAYPACEPAPPEPVAKPEPKPAPPPPEPVKIKAVFESEALFDFDKATLKPEAKTHLDALYGKMEGVDVTSVQVNGHTCSLGPDAYNQKLSERRANSVAGYLTGKGVPSDKLTATGFGESKPAHSNDTREGRKQNRRVVVEVTGLKAR
ncbi:MAG: OmpA family protein [Gammaproteobacteria bacterium]